MASTDSHELLFTAEASTPEILRCQKKDESQVISLASKVRALAQKILGPRRWIRWRNELDLAAQLSYYASTTLAGLQTLGEEYMYLIQIYSRQQVLPSNSRRLIFLTLQILAPYFWDKILSMMIDPKWQILQFLRRSRLQYLHRLHLAIFYISGGYYSLSKRLTNIKHLSLRQQMDEDDPSTIELANWFKVAGYLSILEMASSLVLFIYTYLTQKRPKSHSTTPPRNCPKFAKRFICDICLEDQGTPCCAPCGHLSCWRCFLTAASTGNKACHVCRTILEPCRIIPLMNL